MTPDRLQAIRHRLAITETPGARILADLEDVLEHVDALRGALERSLPLARARADWEPAGQYRDEMRAIVTLAEEALR